MPTFGFRLMWETLALAALCGVTGQGIRVLFGLRKIQSQASAEGRVASDIFTASKLLLSLCLGALAGLLAGITVAAQGAVVSLPDTEQLVLFFLAGYVGSDILEGVVKAAFPRQFRPTSAFETEITHLLANGHDVSSAYHHAAEELSSRQGQQFFLPTGIVAHCIVIDPGSLADIPDPACVALELSKAGSRPSKSQIEEAFRACRKKNKSRAAIVPPV